MDVRRYRREPLIFIRSGTEVARAERSRSPRDDCRASPRVHRHSTTRRPHATDRDDPRRANPSPTSISHRRLTARSAPRAETRPMTFTDLPVPLAEPAEAVEAFSTKPRVCSRRCRASTPHERRVARGVCEALPSEHTHGARARSGHDRVRERETPRGVVRVASNAQAGRAGRRARGREKPEQRRANRPVKVDVEEQAWQRSSATAVRRRRTIGEHVGELVSDTLQISVRPRHPSRRPLNGIRATGSRRRQLGEVPRPRS